MIDVSKFEWSTDHKNWWQPPNSDMAFELWVSGTEKTPSALSIALAERVLANSAGMVTHATDYLKEFVALDKLNSAGDWELESIYCDGDTKPAVARFEFGIEEDIYGLWSVEFMYDASFGFHPNAFGRRNY